MGQKLFGFETDAKWDYENGFHLTSHPSRIAKLLAQYELYKMTIGLPGELVECGVFKGASLLRFSLFRDITGNPYARKIIGFDAFGKFPEQTDIHDAKFIEGWEQVAGDGISKEALEAVMAYKGHTNFEFVQGDLMKTIPAYLEANPALKISLLHLDVDVYEPTLFFLEQLYDRVVRGGVVVFDGYAKEVGETRAIDAFFESRPVLIEKLQLSHMPAYVI